jgi:hypothetical protein
MALQDNLAFVTVMDVSLIDREILSGGTIGFEYLDADLATAVHNLPFKNTVEPTKLSGTIDGVTGVVTTAGGTVTITETLKIVTFNLVDNNFDEITNVTSGFTLTVIAHTPDELIIELEDTVAGYITTNATLDTLTISNVTQEGPRKEARGGKNNIPVIRYGKTARLELEDVVFNLNALSYLSAAEVSTDLTTIDFIETYPKNCSIIGDTHVVDKATGDRSNAYLVFYNFLPDGLMNINMESEGDIGVMSAAGELFSVDNKFFTIIEKV